MSHSLSFSSRFLHSTRWRRQIQRRPATVDRSSCAYCMC
uniref:Uncharacterized protein n=1 Tax=Anguilla anguilla TaxID=7936 RepID=A0A0E9PY43_ANGAN